MSGFLKSNEFQAGFGVTWRAFLKFLKFSNFQNFNITRYEMYIILLNGYKKLNPIQSSA
jgi:hypothetical protein